MSKNKDLIQILIIVIAGMFIPFFLSVIINFGIDISNINDLTKILLTFCLFLIIFGIELIFVYIYFYLTNLYATKKMKNKKSK